MADNIMLVENEQALRGELAAALGDDVFVVAEVSDYFEALWKLGEFKPDLVLLDEDLPFVNGWEACRQISQTFKIPVIVMGDDSSTYVWEKAFEVGAEFYLRMPCSRLVLEARIKAILRRYKKGRVISGD